MRRFALLTALALVAACSDQAPVSGPGTLTATLVGPNGAEGAAVVTILGDIDAVSAAGGTELHTYSESSITHVVLIHPTGGTLAFEVSVPDTTQPPSVVIDEVAGPDDELRADITAYTVEFGR